MSAVMSVMPPAGPTGRRSAGRLVSAGRTDLTNGFDLFKGTGSFFSGLQGGYNVVLPSRLMLGVEADASFPNSIAGTSVGVSNAGIASYGDTVLSSGTMRGRLGYVLDNNWLVYGTGGFAWSYDQLTERNWLAACCRPARTRVHCCGGLAGPQARASKFQWPRTGALAWSISTQASAAAAGISTRRATPSIPTCPLQEVRLGLNYKLFADAPGQGGSLITKAPSLPTEQTWAVHGQTTFVEQYAAPFHAPYSGPNSLASNSGRETWDATAYLGLRLWDGAEAWINRKSTRALG